MDDGQRGAGATRSLPTKGPGFGWRRGLALFLVILVLDQLTKALILAALGTGGRIEVLPFFNLVLVWNPGVSFGMMRSLGLAGPWLLIAIALVIVAGLLFWLRRERRALPSFAIWLVLAGAIGNVIDRLRFGAVVDFLDFHVTGWHWPAFNVADSAIVVGACLLALDSLLPNRQVISEREENT